MFDIHGGGLDLIFPHHENEIAQSRCAHGTATMANYWMHNGFLEVEGEKMSKSLGNFVTIRELLNDWPGEALRLNMLKTHYRSPIDWTLKSLEESKRVVDSWYDIVGDDTQATGGTDEDVLSLLGDDLNTSGAITRLHAIACQPNGIFGKDPDRYQTDAQGLRDAAWITGQDEDGIRQEPIRRQLLSTRTSSMR